MKKLASTTSHARNSTTIMSKLATVSVSPVRLPMRSSRGRPASMPRAAIRPGCRNCSCVIEEPDASRPRPAKEVKMILASQLKLPMMKANAPT